MGLAARWELTTTAEEIFLLRASVKTPISKELARASVGIYQY
jgi:hypothetical protein